MLFAGEFGILDIMTKCVLTKKITALLLLAALMGCAGRQPEPVRVTMFAMDTVMVLTVYGDMAGEAAHQAGEELDRLEQLFSVTLPGSDIARVNAAAGETVYVSAQTAEVLTLAVELWEETGGSFSPGLYTLSRAWGFTTGENRVPEENELVALLENINVASIQLDGNALTLPPGMELDLGAIAKGYAADRLAEVLTGLGVESAILSLGGDVVALGSRPDGSPWRVAIRDPGGDGFLGVVEARDQVVSTSGSNERWFAADDGSIYHHILDPRTGRPVENELISVTVVASSGVRSDAISTALFVMGLEEGIAFTARTADIEAVFLTQSGQIYATGGLEGVFLPEDVERVSWV